MQIIVSKINLETALKMVDESGENIRQKNIDRLVYRNLTGDHSIGGAESDTFKVGKEVVLTTINQYSENLYISGVWLIVNRDLPDIIFMMDIEFVQKYEEPDYMEDLKKCYK